MKQTILVKRNTYVTNSMSKRGRKTDAQRDNEALTACKTSSNVKCFSCGERGHIKRNYKRQLEKTPDSTWRSLHNTIMHSDAERRTRARRAQGSGQTVQTARKAAQVTHDASPQGTSVNKAVENGKSNISMDSIAAVTIGILVSFITLMWLGALAHYMCPLRAATVRAKRVSLEFTIVRGLGCHLLSSVTAQERGTNTIIAGKLRFEMGGVKCSHNEQNQL